MPETVINKQGLSLAEVACLHAIERTKNDANFRHYMLHTETLSLCMQAEAARREVAAEVIREEVLDTCHDDRQAEVVELRKRLERVEEVESGTTSLESRLIDQVMAVESLLRRWWLEESISQEQLQELADVLEVDEVLL